MPKKVLQLEFFVIKRHFAIERHFVQKLKIGRSLNWSFKAVKAVRVVFELKVTQLCVEGNILFTFAFTPAYSRVFIITGIMWRL